ncbi:hypothetical protein QWA68_005619 [Fusarium oxysporum]|nr:hypothetical protein QWA68_005619 [Fusarium oxysporum]
MDLIEGTWPINVGIITSSSSLFLLCHSRTKVRAIILRRPLTPQSWIPEQNASAQNQEATNEPVRNGYADCRSPTSDFSRCSVREYQKNSYIVHYEHRSIMRPMSTPEVKV